MRIEYKILTGRLLIKIIKKRRLKIRIFHTFAKRKKFSENLKFMGIYENWSAEIKKFENPVKAKILQGFFKTGKGEYGEGDIFIGATIPQIRSLTKKFRDAPYSEILKMLESPFHDFRLSGMLVLVEKFERDENERKNVVDFYLENTKHINNWDLVDLTCYKILGVYTLNGHREILEKLSDSTNFWEQRIAIVSTMKHVKNGDFALTLKFAEKYLNHTEPLIHKATGWLLREVGKKNIITLLNFLNTHASKMPRTALRYAIERLNPEQKRHYMSIKRG